MINTNELKGIIAKNSLTQAKLAKMLGMTSKTFYTKMKKGVFGSDEIFKMIFLLNIKDPIKIFFDKEVTHEVTPEPKKSA